MENSKLPSRSSFWSHLLVATVLGVCGGVLGAFIAVSVYKSSCEVIGNQAGEKWLECSL